MGQFDNIEVHKTPLFDLGETYKKSYAKLYPDNPYRLGEAMQMLNEFKEALDYKKGVDAYE